MGVLTCTRTCTKNSVQNYNELPSEYSKEDFNENYIKRFRLIKKLTRDNTIAKKLILVGLTSGDEVSLFCDLNSSNTVSAMFIFNKINFKCNL